MNAQTDAPTLAGPVTGPLTVRPVTSDAELDTLLALGGSFLQTPAWADAKPDWRRQFLGWFDASDTLVGAGLVLARDVPRTRKCFAYLPEGPALPWDVVAADPAAWFEPLRHWARSAGAFAVRVGCPTPSRIWPPEVVKKQIGEGGLLSFTTIPPAVDNPAARSLETWFDGAGWTPVGWGTSAAVGQPRLLCIVDLTGRDAPTVLRGMNQQWRRNIKKAEKAGVRVRTTGLDGLDAFYEQYTESANRDRFYPRPKFYFERIMKAFEGDDRVSARFYEAHVDGDILASSLMIRVGRTFSYLYGGSTSRNRDARASNALQWQAIQDAVDAGCTAYDFRGFNTSLGATSPLTGLLLFKLGAGADVVEMVGERELVISRFWHRAFEGALQARVAITKWRKRGQPQAEEAEV